VVLVADVLAHRLRHHTGSTHDHAAGHGVGDGLVEGMPPGGAVVPVSAVTAFPRLEVVHLVADGVDVTHLQMHRRTPAGSQLVNERGNALRHHTPLELE